MARATTAGAANETGLLRRLTQWGATAVAFASCGATAGLFSLYGFSLSSSGPAFIWGWLLVAIEMGAVVLVFAELASHYPFAGSMYQWPARLVGERLGWWVGWLYLFAQIAVLNAVYFVLPLSLIPLFGLPNTLSWQLGIALGALVVATLVNGFGVKALGRTSQLGVIAELIVLVGITSLVLIFGHSQSPRVFLSSGGTATSLHQWLPTLFAGGIMVSLWVLYMFETGGTVGEETADARRAAPRAIIGAWIGSVVVGFYFLGAFILSTPDIKKNMASGTPITDIVNHALPDEFSKLFLALIAGVTILNANAIFTATSRQLFSMARNGHLPFAKQLARTRNGSPLTAIVVVAVLTGLPFFVSQQVSVLTIGATATIYLCYVMVMVFVIIARLRGWPGERAVFSLGRWGLPITVFAFVTSLLVALTLFWPRDSINPVWHFGIRAAYWIVGIPLIMGAIYYAVAGRHKYAPKNVDVDHSAIITRAASSGE